MKPALHMTKDGTKMGTVETSDRELLEYAAKAAGIEWAGFCEWRGLLIPWDSLTDPSSWNPLHDDGDALRLAVKLRLAVRNSDVRASVMSDIGGVTEPHGTDPYAATRRAIVRAAAEIGKGMA